MSDDHDGYVCITATVYIDASSIKNNLNCMMYFDVQVPSCKVKKIHLELCSMHV